jgi:hypothetical protein
LSKGLPLDQWDARRLSTLAKSHNHAGQVNTLMLVRSIP